MIAHEAPYASKPEIIGGGNVGSVKPPTATPRTSGAIEISQYTVDPHSGQKWYVAPPLSQERNVTGFPLSLGNVHVVDSPSIVTCSFGSRACTLNTLPVRFWHS